MTKDERIKFLKKEWRSIRESSLRVKKYTREKYGVAYEVDGVQRVRELVAKGWKNLTTKELNEIGVRQGNLVNRSTVGLRGFKKMEPFFDIAVEQNMELQQVFEMIDELEKALANVPYDFKYRVAEKISKRQNSQTGREEIARLFRGINRVMMRGGDVSEFISKVKYAKKLVDI